MNAPFDFDLDRPLLSEQVADKIQAMILSESLNPGDRLPSERDLGSQLGMGAFEFIREGKFGNMVSVGDNLEIKSVPFEDLIDSHTFRTRLRYVPINGDFFKLAKALEFRRQYEE